jgi:Tfp pilus assembly protein PilO
MEELMIDKLNELCLWLSHQKGMMSQDYAKELAKIIVRLRQQADRITELEKYEQQIKQMERAYDAHLKKAMGLNDNNHS